MRDLDKFREKIKEYLEVCGLNQTALVATLGSHTQYYTAPKLSRQLNNKMALTDMEVLEIIKGMVRIRAVKKYSDAQSLLETMEVDFDEVDWETEPLARLKGRPVTDLQKLLEEKDEEIKLLRSQLQISKEATEHEQEVAAARAEMEKATSREEQLAAYRRALQADQNLALIHVLDMTRPLSLDEMYIKLRLHEHKKSYKLETELVEAETKADPNEHIRVSRLLLANKTTKSYEPAQAIRENKHIVVLGDPGAGKTTMMKYLALRSVRGKLQNLPNFPIHIILSRLAPDLKKANETGRGFSLVEWVAGYWQERYNFPREAASQLIEECFQSGEALLLLDGLDETVTGSTEQAAKESYDMVTNLIQNFTNHHPKVRVIVTVRFAGFTGNLPGFVQFEVLDFTSEDIEQFVTNWYRSDPEHGRELKRQLKQNSRVETLAANPLLLTLIAIVFEGSQGFPQTRIELYEKCVETLLEKWDSTRRIKRVGSFGKKQKEWLLTEIGWHFQKRRQRYLPGKALLAAIGKLLPAAGLDSPGNGRESQQILSEIAAEHGLLKEQASDYYGFLHLTLQEYYAALYAAKHPEVIPYLIEQRDNPWWHEVILLYVGEVEDINPFLSEVWKLVEENRDDVFHTYLLLAGECLAVRRTFNLPNPTMKTRVIGELFKLVLDKTEYLLNRRRSIERLAAAKEQGIATHLIDYLANNERWDISVRWDIADAIGQLGDTSVLPQLLTLLTNYSLDNTTRWKLAGAIGQLGDTSVLPQLLALLTDETLGTNVLEFIAIAIGQLGDTSVLPRLLALLTDETLNSHVRRSIADAIGQLGDTSVLPQLLTALTDKTLNSDVRWSIADAIGQLENTSVLPRLLALLTDKTLSNDVRRNIAVAILQLGDTSVLPQLLTALTDKTLSNDVRWDIADAIGQLGDTSLLPQLLALLTDETLNSDVRRNIAVAILQLGDTSLLPQLLAALTDKTLSNDVRRNIAVAILQLGDTSLLPQLLTALTDKTLSNDVRWDIADAIGQLGDTSLLPQLLALLTDKTLGTDVRKLIAVAAVNTTRTRDDLEQTAILLQEHDVFTELQQASQRVGGVRLYWVDKKKKLLSIVVEEASGNKYKKPEKPKPRLRLSKIFELFRKQS